MAISVGSVAVDVVPSTKTFASDLRAKVKDVSVDVRVNADTTAAKAKLDETARPRTARIKADADTTAASAKIDAAARNRKSKIDVSAAGTGITAILALGPALVPITAAVVGLGAAFALPVAAAGGGLTLGAVVAGAAIKQTETQQKKITELAKKVTAAKQSLANVQASSAGSASIATAAAQAAAQRRIDAAQVALNGAKSPAAAAAAERQLATARASLATSLATTQARSSLQVANAQRKVTQATAAYDVAVKGLTPAQARFLETQKKLKDSFKGLVSSAGSAIFGPVITGMDTLSKIMPTLKGPLVAVSHAVGTLLSDVSKSASGPAFKNFMNAFGAASASAIVSFGRTFGNFAKGTFGLMTAFAPLSKVFMGGLSDLSKRFADWGTTVGQSKGFQSFLAYIRDVGPKVADTLGSVVKAVVRIAIALAPIGALALGGIKVLADTIQKIPVPILTATAGAIISVVVALKAAQIINSGSQALDKLSTSINKFRGADSQLSKVQVGIRGLSGAAGLGALTVGASTSNHALGILASAGGGAMLGFSLGGPVGAAIGAGAGALFGLATQASKAKDSFKRSIPTLADYASTLDSVTGATTRLTRHNAFLALQQSGAINAGKKFGLSSRTLVSATLGDPKALAIYNKAVNAYRKERDAFIASGGMGSTEPADLAEKKHLADLAKTFNTLTDAVGANTDKFKSDVAVQRDDRLASLDLGKALKGLPSKAITEIGLKGFPTTQQQLVDLARKYNLTPTQIQTLIKVSGIPATVRAVARLQRDLNTLAANAYTVRVKFTGIGPLAPTSALFGPGVIVQPKHAGARGAIVTRPTVALIGEAGPERLTPLDQAPGASPLPSGGGGEFHGVLSIDRNGVAYVDGRAQQAVDRAGMQARQNRRHAGLDGVRRP